MVPKDHTAQVAINKYTYPYFLNKSLQIPKHINVHIPRIERGKLPYQNPFIPP